MRIFSGWKADTTIATASMLIALCALVLTVYQISESRKFEKLRFQPVLQFSFGKNNTDGFFITLYNNGLGIAEIKYFRLLYDDVEISHWGQLLSKVHENSSVELPPTGFDSFQVPSGYIPPENENQFIFKETDPKWADELWSQSDRISLTACACSLLGECKVFNYTTVDRLMFIPECTFESEGFDFFDVPPDF